MNSRKGKKAPGGGGPEDRGNSRGWGGGTGRRKGLFKRTGRGGKTSGWGGGGGGG